MTGWGLRPFGTIALVLGAFIIAAIALFKNADWWTTDWVALERHAKESLTAAQQGSEGITRFLMSSVLSAAPPRASYFEVF